MTLIIPCLNEKEFIRECLLSLYDSDYPMEQVEILVVDGMSDDGTRDILNEISQHYDNLKIIDNPGRIIPVALNIGIKKSRGEIIIRIDAHSTYAPEYISKCVEYINKTGADNVGGVVEHRGKGFVGESIALAQECKFGLGGAKFRTAIKEQYVDTVFPGVWPKRIFEKYGTFNEKLARNQDIEFNSRIRKNGGKIFLTPEIKSQYYCRSNIKDLWKQNFGNGYWNIKTVKIAPGTLSLRHFVPLIFIVSLLVTWVVPVLWLCLIMSYLFCNLFFSLKIAFSKGFKYLFVVPITFMTLHFSYGFGSLGGIFMMKK